MSRGLFLRLVLLVAACWVVIANLRLIGTAVDKASSSTLIVNEKIKMAHSCEILRSYYVTRGQLPRTPRLVIEKAVEAEDGCTDGLHEDQWGTRYRFIYTPSGFAMLSAGADQEFGSDDDIRFDQSLTALGYTYQGATGTR